MAAKTIHGSSAKGAPPKYAKRVSMLESARAFVDKHQITWSLALVLCAVVPYLLGKDGYAKYLFVSHPYPLENSPLFRNGPQDIHFLGFYIVFFVLVRACILQFALRPFARRIASLKKQKTERFALQLWNIIYYSVSWGYGMYLYVGMPYATSLVEGFRGYPQVGMSKEFKYYYLLELAVWLQQFITLLVEKEQKEFWEMLVHHITTSLLVSTSYVMHFTSGGHTILVIMDVVDILLALAKAFDYINAKMLSNLTFVVFFVVWIITRIGLFGWVIYETAFKLPTAVIVRWDPQNDYFSSMAMQRMYLAFFGTLQLLIYYWTYLIYKVLRSALASDLKDVRSDDEGETDKDK